MAFTKQHFELVADVISSCRENPTIRSSKQAAAAMEDAFVLHFKRENSRFSEGKFREACK